VSPRGRGVRADGRERERAREAIEREYGGLLEIDDAFASLVTGEEAAGEPWHRWLPYRQKFSPGLVRRFLELTKGSVLDPFGGSGTTVIAAAQAGVRAVCVEAVPVLAFLTNARFEGSPRADALFLAAGAEAAWLAADRAQPLPRLGGAIVGDARRLPFGSASFGRIVTSPPYLSRYDYVGQAAPLSRLFDPDRAVRPGAQIRAAVRRRTTRKSTTPLPDAAEEAARELDAKGARRNAALVRGYFADLDTFLAEAQRVLRKGAPLWLVLGGADIDREYVPTDLIAAAQARCRGFTLEGITVARRLRAAQRFLGTLRGVAPRECVVRLRA
jgi:hypothetical protein